MKRSVEVISQETVYDGFFRMSRFRLRHALFQGGVTETLVRERFERGHAVGVLLYDPWEDAVVLVEQFRIGALERHAGAWMLETVAGIIEPGESPEDVARRETREEADTEIGELVPIAHYLISPGGSSQTVKLYCAPVDSRNLVLDGHGNPEEGEDIRLHVIPAEQAIAMLNTGGLHAAMPIIALQWLALNRESLQSRWQDLRRDQYTSPGSVP